VIERLRVVLTLPDSSIVLFCEVSKARLRSESIKPHLAEGENRVVRAMHSNQPNQWLELCTQTGRPSSAKLVIFNKWTAREHLAGSSLARRSNSIIGGGIDTCRPLKLCYIDSCGSQQ